MSKLNDTLEGFPSISKELINTIDWAWLIDFGQGNFTEAKAMTEIALLSEWNTTNLLARALVHQLQGEYERALSLLEQAFSIENDPKNKLFITTITYLIERKTKENLVNGFSIIATKTDIDTAWKQKTKFLKREVKDLNYHLIINLIQEIAAILPRWRTTIVRYANKELQEQYKKLILEHLTKQLELYQEKQYYAVSELIYCYFAELLALGGQSVAGWQLFDNLIPAYLNSKKYLEAAWYLMCQGDLIVETVPFGKPIVFGYRFTEYKLDLIELKLLDRSVIDTVSAQQQYLQARHYFTMANAPRGEAMAIMRLSYVNAIQKQWYLAVHGYEEAQKIFLQMGDCLNAIAAQMGYLWCVLQCEAISIESLANLKESARWMLKNGTVSFAMSWLLAFTAAAQEALLQDNQIVVSQRLVEVAEILATEALNATVVFDSVSSYQLWQNCCRAISDFYRHLSVTITEQNKWQQAFVTAEKAKIYSAQSYISDSQQIGQLVTKIKSIPSLEKIAELLPFNTLLLSFVVTNTKLLGWAITRKGLVKTSLLNQIGIKNTQADSLEQTINVWLNNLSEPQPVVQLNQVLADFFLEPFAEEIATNKHLVITTCDRLQGLSFAALKYQYDRDLPILKKEIILGEEKSLSYLLFASEIVDCELIATMTDRVLIVTEDGYASDNEQTTEVADSLDTLSLFKALAFAIVKIYNTSTLDKLIASNAVHLSLSSPNLYREQMREVTQEIGDIMNLKQIIHLFISESTFWIDELRQQDLTNELIIVNVRDFKIKQLPNKQLNNLIQTLMNGKVKTVVLIFEGENTLATAILTLFFHQGLYFGQSVAEALRQAQKQLRTITAQEALDFCHYLQSHIPWQTKSDRALRALITKYTGDIMVLGQDYYRATEAYSVATKILENVGYHQEAESLQNKYKMLKSLQKISQPFQANNLIFDTLTCWNCAYIYGDWQLSFVGL